MHGKCARVCKRAKEHIINMIIYIYSYNIVSSQIKSRPHTHTHTHTITTATTALSLSASHTEHVQPNIPHIPHTHTAPTMPAAQRSAFREPTPQLASSPQSPDSCLAIIGTPSYFWPLDLSQGGDQPRHQQRNVGRPRSQKIDRRV